VLSICTFLSTKAFSQINSDSFGIIPQPIQQKLLNGQFKLISGYSIKINGPDLKDLSIYFQEKVDALFQINSSAFNENKKMEISLVIDPKIKGGEEAYQLKIGKKSIVIIASNKAGVFYGMQSLLQLCFQGYKSSENIILIPCCRISDAPRFSWRGIMLDESRHFFGMDKVKQLIDLMAFHKLNRFHWHLTDATGWRIEIKKYPKLTIVGGKGCYSDPESPVVFYTQDQIKEIVKYAKDRCIVVIPEIDMPGHATAAVTAYPQFSGGGSEKHPNFTFHPAKEETYEFLDDILKEVVDLFPAPWLHIGMDEVHFGNEKWASMPEVKSLMERNNIDDLKGVEKYFSQRMDTVVQRFGKVTTGWDEIVSHELPADHSLIMWWRHDHPEVLTKALNMKYPTVICPRIPYYFDFVQHESHENGRRWRGDFADLEKVYEYQVLPKGVSTQQLKFVKGIQANIWTERIQNDLQFDYMVYPRLSAFAESSWSREKDKSYDDFMGRMQWMFRFYETENLNFFNVFDPEKSPEPEF